MDIKCTIALLTDSYIKYIATVLPASYILLSNFKHHEGEGKVNMV